MIDILQLTPWDFLCKAMPGTAVSDFEFGMPMHILKKGNLSPDEQGKRYISGVASTPDKDLQEEVVVQKGMDLKYFLKHGYFNNDHKPGFENKVGQPTRAEIKKVKDVNGKDVVGLYVEGYLWDEGKHGIADSIYELAKALDESSSDRKLGLSIQGKVLQREGDQIMKAWIQDIAITPSPVNTHTWMTLVDNMDKSWISVQETDTMLKSINESTIDIDSLMNHKALSVTPDSVVVPESLEGNRKDVLEPKKTRTIVDESIEKAYAYWINRGWDTHTAKRLALVATARTLLSS